MNFSVHQLYHTAPKYDTFGFGENESSFAEMNISNCYIFFFVFQIYSYNVSIGIWFETVEFSSKIISCFFVCCCFVLHTDMNIFSSMSAIYKCKIFHISV